MKVGAFEAKTHLSALLEKVSRGEEVLILKHGKDIAHLDLLTSLSIVPGEETGPRAFRVIIILARAQSLTNYDAAILELAIRQGAPLATQDKALVRATKDVGVDTLPAKT